MDMAPPQPVTISRIATVRPVKIPASLDSNGSIVHDQSDAEILCSPISPSRDGPDVYRPVRLQVGYESRADSHTVRESITQSSSLPWALPELIGFWKLEDLRGAQSGSNLTVHGNANFSDDRSGYLGGGTIDRRARTLELFTQPPGLADPGYVDIQLSRITALQHLGTNLHLQLWVMPVNGPNLYPTLIGNNYKESFWLGLHKKATGYLPRLWVNQKGPLEATRSIPINQWSHVAVQYDGHNVTFFIDGAPAGSVTANFGRVSPNTRGTLCIGCDPRFRRVQVTSPGGPGGIGVSIPPIIEITDPFAYPFSGFLADVQIWGGFIPLPDAADPKLLAYWGLNGDLSESKAGSVATFFGSARFEPDHPQYGDRRVLALDGSVALESEVPKDPGDRLTIQAWIKPEAGQTRPTLINNDGAAAFSISLEPTGPEYHLALDYRGARYLSDEPNAIPADYWAQINVAIGPRRVAFYINGKLAGVRATPFVGIPANSDGRLTIGGSLDLDATRRYRGRLADVALWASTLAPPNPAILNDKSNLRGALPSGEATSVRTVDTQENPDGSLKFDGLRAAWPLDGQALDAKTLAEEEAFGTLRYEAGHPLDDQRRVLALPGTACIDVRRSDDNFFMFADKLTLKARIWPESTSIAADPFGPGSSERPTMTILSCDRETSFAFGLQSAGGGDAGSYKLSFFINGREFRSSALVPAHAWSKVAVTYDGSRVRFYLEDQLDPAPEGGYEASLGSIAERSSPWTRIGGEIDADRLRVTSTFRGKLADVEIWARVPDSPDDALPSASDLIIPADTIAHGMPDGDYRFWAQGIDIFGRVSTKSFGDVSLDSFRPPPAPGGARAQFIPLRGRVAAIVQPEEGTGEPFQISARVEGAELDTVEPSNLQNYDIEVLHPAPANPIREGSSSWRAQAYEILNFRRDPPGGPLTFDVQVCPSGKPA